jgi:5-methylcytosine-specific restriction endonuclease McrA
VKTAQQKKSDKAYAARPEQIKKRTERNAARAALMKKGVVHKGDGLEVDHKTPIARGGGNAQSNLQAVPAAQNEGWRKGKKGKQLPT